MMNIKHVLIFVVITFFTGYVNAQNYPEDIIRKHEIVCSHPPEKIPVDHAVDAVDGAGDQDTFREGLMKG